MTVDINAVKSYFLDLQTRLCDGFSNIDGQADFISDQWQREQGGGGITRILTDGALFEKAGVNFSHVHGSQLPKAASATRPELAGRSFQAMGVSVVIHPENPFVPTMHANVRFFIAEKDDHSPIWWFGGGFDLTPYYPFVEDCQHWHRNAKAACDPFGTHYYPQFKQQCDDYFYLPHRQECRGVGGLFFDDLNAPDFEHCFALCRSIGDHIAPGYLPIVEKRHQLAFTEREKHFQEYRRGRYVEFNLIYDRGTLFGLQSGGRTESILMSLPAIARWQYNWQPEKGSKEAELYRFLTPRDWLAE